MKRTAGNLIFWQTIVRSVAMTLLVGILEALAFAQTISDLSGVRNSSGMRRLTDKQLQQIRETLSQKSGFVELGFDSQGALTLGNRQNTVGGSATARALLVAAVDSDNLYELENHDRSESVAFAQIFERGDRVISQTRKMSTVYQLQIDFADFGQLSGSNEAKASFDLGITLLHELVHGVFNLQDPQEMNQIGDCDAHINQIRRELRLPERLYYHPIVTTVKTGLSKIVIVAELEFVETSTGRGAKFKLNWLPVNISPSARNIAQLQTGAMKAR